MFPLFNRELPRWQSGRPSKPGRYLVREVTPVRDPGARECSVREFVGDYDLREWGPCEWVHLDDLNIRESGK